MRRKIFFPLKPNICRCTFSRGFNFFSCAVSSRRMNLHPSMHSHFIKIHLKDTGFFFILAHLCYSQCVQHKGTLKQNNTELNELICWAKIELFCLSTPIISEVWCCSKLKQTGKEIKNSLFEGFLWKYFYFLESF